MNTSKPIEQYVKSIRPSHPRISNYRRVLSVLKQTSGLWERANKEIVGVFTPNRQSFDFPHDVVAVTEVLHKKGLMVGWVTAGAIRKEAIRIVLNESPPKPERFEPKASVISFRIPTEAANALDEMMNERQIIGIASRNQFVRRFTLDSSAHQLLQIGEDTPPKPEPFKPSPCIISFRIPKESARRLDELRNIGRFAGARSRHDVVRKLAMDFITKRLAYPVSHEPKVDWQTQQTKTANVI